jgi:hypothetical protein
MSNFQSAEGPASKLHDDVAAAISGMIYISESEAPLELLACPGVQDLPSLQQAIEQRLSLPKSAQSIISGQDFLAGIRRMADPADAAMMDYAMRYEALFALLEAHSKEMVVVRAGRTELQLLIAAFGRDESIIIRTTAIET